MSRHQMRTNSNRRLNLALLLDSTIKEVWEKEAKEFLAVLIIVDSGGGDGLNSLLDTQILAEDTFGLPR